MATRRPISWFLSETGRRFSFGAITVFGIGTTALIYAPNTFFLYKYKEIVHNYSNSKPVPLSPELQQLVTKCMDILDISNVHRSLVQPFSVFGYDLFNAGTIKSKYGVAIGIPTNFTYKSISDIKKDDIKVNQKPINWDSETGRKLADALLFPEKVKEFAICREILAANNAKVVFQSFYPCLCAFFAYKLAQFINHRLNLYMAPAAPRVLMYTLIGSFTVGLYFLANDWTEVNYEINVDKQLCELGPEFIESGVVFYDKMLKRNQALRELMGSEGERKYSKLGNENHILRQPRIALMHRKQFFESKYKELNGEVEDVKKSD